MAKHNTSAHDKEVKRLAEEYKRLGAKVKASVPGYPPPESIAGRIPDIIAQKGTRRDIVEMETPETLIPHKPQHSTFRRHAGQKLGTTVKIVVTKG